MSKTFETDIQGFLGEFTDTKNGQDMVSFPSLFHLSLSIDVSG